MIRIRLMKDVPVVLGTSNQGKIAEIRAVWPSDRWPLVGRDVFTGVEPEETDHTYEGNATIKAKFLANLTAMPALSDDSGLNIHAMKGWPGAFATRNAVDRFTPSQLYEYVRQHVEELDASVSCCVALAIPNGPPVGVDGGAVITTIASIRGKIVPPRGDNGFGFDPIFEVGGTGLTLAEMSNETKLVYSARSRALEQLVKLMK